MINDQYAAGFFDGEGSVYAARRGASRAGQSPTILVCIGNTNLQVLEAHKERWGGSICERGGKHKERVASGRWQRQFQWVLASRMARAFLTAIAPHVIIKKEVVSVALRYCDLIALPRQERVDYSHRVVRRGREWSSPIVRPEFGAKIEALHAAIRHLNAGSAPFNVRRVRDAVRASEQSIGVM